MNFHQLEVRILIEDLNSDPKTWHDLTGQDVRAVLIWNHIEKSLVYDPDAHSFGADDLAPGLYTLRLISIEGESTSEHQIQVDPAPRKITLWTQFQTPVVSEGSSFRVGILPHPAFFQSEQIASDIDSMALSLGLQPTHHRTTAEARNGKIAVFSILSPTGEESLETLLAIAGNAVAKLKDRKEVAVVGRFVGDPRKKGVLLTQKVYLRFKQGTSMSEAKRIAEKHNLLNIERLPYGQDLFLAMVTPERLFQLEDLLGRLRGEVQVHHVESVPIAEVEADCIGNLSWAMWDRWLIGSQFARLLGANNIQYTPVLAVVDRDRQPIEEVRYHPELREANSVSVSRGLASLEFEYGASTSNGDELKAHSLMCLSLAAGSISGVAPRSRVLLFKDPQVDDTHIDAWRWAGGLGYGRLVTADLPELPGGSVDIFCCAVGRPDAVTETGRNALRDLVVVGRRGRGCSLFFSAGNNNEDIIFDRPYGALPFTLSVAASICDPSGKEAFAPYSGWGDIDLCGPSGTSQLKEYYGEQFDGVLGATLPHCGKFPYLGLVEALTTGSAAGSGDEAGEAVPVSKVEGFVLSGHAILIDPKGRWTSREIYKLNGSEILLQTGEFGAFPELSRVVSSSRLVGHLVATIESSSTCLELDCSCMGLLKPGQMIRVGTPSRPNTRSYTISNVSDSRLEVKEKFSAHCIGDQVYLDESHWRMWRGTSTVTPLCAGTAALMLEVNPRLNWVELRHILRFTAVKIDPNCSDPQGAWLGRNGRRDKEQPYFSRRYGFGRLNALEAVRQAIEYDFPRDLMIRRFADDNGNMPAVGPCESPDIWVRSRDPRLLNKEESEDSDLHEEVCRSRDHWIFARVRNRGRANSLEAWVRFYVAAGQEEPYRFPEDFEIRKAVNLDKDCWQRGTQYLGEVEIAGLAPNQTMVVAVRWNQELIPPRLDSEGRHWRPHLLVAISPLDGPEDGVTVLDCNNLAQRAIQINGDV